MRIEEIKKQMSEYRDFYGGDLLVFDEIEKAKTKKELSKIIDRHSSRLEDMLSDAHSHLDNFKKKLGLK